MAEIQRGRGMESKGHARVREGKFSSLLSHDFARNFLPAGCPSYALTCMKQLSVMVSHVHFELQH